MRFDSLVTRFSAADRNTRLETLLDYSRKLPALPERYQAQLASAQPVAECQTPVYLWADLVEGKVRLFAEVPRESPTVRGYLSLLIRGLDGATPDEIAAVPDDLLERLRLVETLGMMRVQGLTAILRRIKLAVAAQAP